ncbi:MAG: phosphoglucosamine mutase, partial [Clostridia bacterium]|nr:phosphoglucosamine mutase [Clostridia bacterium]
QLSAIQMLALCREKGMKLSAMGDIMQRFPQVMINVKADVNQKAIYAADKALAAELEAANASLGNNGRVLVRPSGTEPLIRVMVEGRDFDEINQLAVELAEKIRIAIS